MPTKPRCSIYGCRSSWRTHQGMVFFRFPLPDNPIHEVWLSKCADSAELILNSSKAFVCSKHFYKHNVRGKRLVPGAVPELFLKATPEFEREERERQIEEAEQDRIKKLVEVATLEWVKRVIAHPRMPNTCPSGLQVMKKAKMARNLLGAHLFLRTEIHWVRKFRRLHLDHLQKEDYIGRESKSLDMKDIILDLSPSERILTEKEMAALWKEEKLRAMEDVRKSEGDSIEMSLNSEDGFMECAPTEVAIRSYEQALEYLKPLEDFALQEENYRLIGLLTTMETVMKDPKRGMGP